MLPNVRDVPWVCSSALLSAIHPSRTHIADVFHIFPPHFRPRPAQKGNVKQSPSQRHTAPHHGRGAYGLRIRRCVSYPLNTPRCISHH